MREIPVASYSSTSSGVWALSARRLSAFLSSSSAKMRYSVSLLDVRALLARTHELHTRSQSQVTQATGLTAHVATDMHLRGAR